MVFFFLTLRVTRLLPGRAYFEQGIYYEKAPLSLLLILYITRKKKFPNLYTTLTLSFLFALLFVVVYCCLICCKCKCTALL
jgi:hypothetical protein